MEQIRLIEKDSFKSSTSLPLNLDHYSGDSIVDVQRVQNQRKRIFLLNIIETLIERPYQHVLW